MRGMLGTQQLTLEGVDREGEEIINEPVNIQYIRGKHPVKSNEASYMNSPLVSYPFSSTDNTLEKFLLLIVLSLRGKVAPSL